MGAFTPGCFCGGECNFCSATPPNTIQVVLSGIADNVCADCETIDGTYDCVLSSPTGDNCYWHYYFPGGEDCYRYAVSVFINDTDSTGATSHGCVFVRLRFYNGGILLQDIYWSTTRTIVSGSTVIDCAFSSVNVPFERNDNVLTAECDGAASTCTITSL